MNQLVRDYLNQKEQEKKQISQMEKDKLLLELNLFEKEYSPDGKYSREYPESELDQETNTTRYFKKIPAEVSDEEYAEILQYQKEAKSQQRNGLSTVFQVLAVIVIIGGFFVGIAAGELTGITLIQWVVGFVIGMICLGFGEIIRLLTDIKNMQS